jgi:oxygen-independent coproporphyrinogen-3 oxidase
MDHFAKPGDELSRALDAGTLRRNFMGYTTEDGVDVLAFGPSAISELPGTYVQVDKDLAGWSEAVSRGELATQRGHQLSPDDERRRVLIREVMCQGEIRASAYRSRFGGDFARDFASARARLAPFAEDGLVELPDSGDLRVTPLGRLFLRQIAMVFDAYLDDASGEKPAIFSQTV